VKDLLSFTFI